MPLYDYHCGSCGPFKQWVAMAQATAPQPCPHCAGPAPRSIARPHFRCGGATARYKAEAHNERSANEPKVVQHVGRFGDRDDRHSHEKGEGIHRHSHAARSRRPWMVGH